MCSDPDDPTPSCDGGSGIPANTSGLGDSPVVISNAPLDPGLKQDKPLSSGENPDPDDGLKIEDSEAQAVQCVNFSGGGCVSYISASLGLDAPTIMMLFGVGFSAVGLPEVGLPLALSGAAFEACAFTATPLCAAVKLLSVNVSGTIDEYGNLYLGPQISWGKSILPFVAVSDYIGFVGNSPLPVVPTETETRDTLSGLSFSIGSIATGGISYSPLASTFHTSYYIDGVPEIFAVNVNFNFWVHDFSP
jgi:hypothetical protein